MKKIRSIVYFLFVFLLGSSSSWAVSAKIDKPRLLILTDIGGDPDDIQSLRRLLVYSNEFRIEGIIATATTPGKEKILQIRENHIHDAIDDYASVYDNLKLHAEGFPEAKDLRAVVRSGEANVGVGNLSAGRITPASTHIINAVDSSEELLYISIWGGSHDLAQALLDIKSTRTNEEVEKFISKLRVYAIGDQHNNNFPKGTGEWIRENFPKLWFIESGPTWMDKYSASFRGMYQNDSRGGQHPSIPLVKPGVENLNNAEWVEANVSDWGPLGAGYPSDVKQNPSTERNTSGVKEGDTPSWFYFLLNGLNDPAHPEWGGWGGRFTHQSGSHFVDAQDDHWSGKMDGSVRRKWPVARWREAYQNDFAGRMRWSKLPFKEANHNPVAVINGDKSKDVIIMTVKQGQNVKLDAGGSFDPDGDRLAYHWWIYHEASSATGLIKNGYGRVPTIEIGNSSAEGYIHVILEITDDGDPSLKAYRRAIIKVSSDE